MGRTTQHILHIPISCEHIVLLRQDMLASTHSFSCHHPTTSFFVLAPPSISMHWYCTRIHPYTCMLTPTHRHNSLSHPHTGTTLSVTHTPAQHSHSHTGTTLSVTHTPAQHSLSLTHRHNTLSHPHIGTTLSLTHLHNTLTHTLPIVFSACIAKL